MENSLADHEQRFKAAEDATVDARQEAERARDYVNGKQLTVAEREALKNRGQPPVVLNRIRRKIEWLVGLEVKQRTDPKAFPRTPQHEMGADAITDAIRFVCDKEDWDQERTGVFSDMLCEGFGGAEVVHKQGRNGEVEVAINRYPWDRLYYDPHSRKPDFSDARYKGVVVWMDDSEFREQFGDNKAAIAAVDGMYSECGGVDTYDDRPHLHWIDPKRKRIRVVLEWCKKGGNWYYTKFVKGAVLEQGDSPYVDDHGDSVCPLILQSAYVDRDNARYGIVRDMIDPQDEINKRRSKALHLFTMRQVKMTRGVADPATVREQLARPDGLIEIEGGSDDVFDIMPTGDIASAHASLLQEAKEEIDLMGANSALAGETGESASGRAVLARQQGGMIEIAWMFDRLHSFTREIYRHIWMRILQFWTEQRWIRVTDDESNARFVGLNRPVTFGEKLQQLPPDQIALVAQQMALRPDDPRLNMPVDVENPVEQIDVDIVIEEVPDRVTLQGETFEAMLKYAQSGTLPPQVLIQMDPGLPARKKEQLLEMFQQPQQPTPDQELMMAEKAADVQKTQAETAKIQAETGMPLAGIA